VIELPRHDTYATVTPPRAHLLIHDGDGEVAEGYEYATEAGAHMALLSWQARQFEGEPRGWIYHAPSMRYRPGGEPEGEMLLSPAARVLRLSSEVTADATEISPGGSQT
jgi:hypothetical protein